MSVQVKVFSPIPRLLALLERVGGYAKSRAGSHQE
jgi:hypothetical protein